MLLFMLQKMLPVEKHMPSRDFLSMKKVKLMKSFRDASYFCFSILF